MIIDKNTVLSKTKLVLKFANRNRVCEKNLFLDLLPHFERLYVTAFMTLIILKINLDVMY